MLDFPSIGLNLLAAAATQATVDGADSAPSIPAWAYVIACILASPVLIRAMDFFRRREWTTQRTLGSMRTVLKTMERRVRRLEKDLERITGLYRKRTRQVRRYKRQNIRLKVEVNDLLGECSRPPRYHVDPDVVVFTQVKRPSSMPPGSLQLLAPGSDPIVHPASPPAPERPPRGRSKS